MLFPFSNHQINCSTLFYAFSKFIKLYGSVYLQEFPRVLVRGFYEFPKCCPSPGFLNAQVLCSILETAILSILHAEVEFSPLSFSVEMTAHILLAGIEESNHSWIFCPCLSLGSKSPILLFAVAWLTHWDAYPYLMFQLCLYEDSYSSY